MRHPMSELVNHAPPISIQLLSLIFCACLVSHVHSDTSPSGKCFFSIIYCLLCRPAKTISHRPPRVTQLSAGTMTCLGGAGQLVVRITYITLHYLLCQMPEDGSTRITSQFSSWFLRACHSFRANSWQIGPRPRYMCNLMGILIKYYHNLVYLIANTILVEFSWEGKHNFEMIQRRSARYVINTYTTHTTIVGPVMALTEEVTTKYLVFVYAIFITNENRENQFDNGEGGGDCLEFFYHSCLINSDPYFYYFQTSRIF